jgi:hypothetical protein
MVITAVVDTIDRNIIKTQLYITTGTFHTPPDLADDPLRPVISRVSLRPALSDVQAILVLIKY